MIYLYTYQAAQVHIILALRHSILTSNFALADEGLAVECRILVSYSAGAYRLLIHDLSCGLHTPLTDRKRWNPT